MIKLVYGCARLDNKFIRIKKYYLRNIIIIIGIILLIIGLLWPLIGKLPLGRLPGDIIVNRPGFRLYIPITTMIVISIVISLIMWILRK
jgi:hypothetical protein